MKIKVLATSILLSSSFLASTANADVGFGVGVSLIYGEETGFDVGVGPKLFTTNEEKKVAASAGIDYLVKSSSFRPNIGVSYLFKEDAYADINVGYNLKSQSIDFGLGGGYTKTEKDQATEIIRAPIPEEPIPEEPIP